MITARARSFIRRRAPGPPFFLYAAYTAPHKASGRRPYPPRCPGAAQPAPRHARLYEAIPLPRPPSFNERDVSDKPRQGRKPVGRLPLLRQHDIDRIKKRYRCALEALRSVDEGVGAILDELAAVGELDKTVIVFTSDNGYFVGEYRIPGEKNRAYEEAIRVPLVIRGPGFARGRVSSRLAANPDLTRTILDAARARPGLPPDGVSLLRGAGSRRAIPIESEYFRGVRSRRFKYVVNAGGERELYDLRRDPYELRNAISADRYRDALARMRTLHARLRRCEGAACR
ncbi:MAG: sulfatase-like hydrolase/transferase [Solirubrobacterales bacterium]